MTLALAALSLAACEPTTIEAEGPPDPMGEELANAAPVTLPPAIVASHSYRCKDNSLVAVDWLSDGTTNTARVTADGGAAVGVTQATGGGAYTAEGVSLTGDPQGPAITYNGKSCRR